MDGEEKINALLPVLDEMITEGLVTVETVEVVSYRAREPRPGNAS